MRYALLLYADVVAARAATRAQADREMDSYRRITQALAEEGVLRGGEAFLPASQARRVRHDGEQVTAFPVPEGELELSGFFVVECDEDRAEEIAASMPVASHGEVEIRPLLDLPAPDAASSA